MRAIEKLSLAHAGGGTSRFDHNGIVYQGVCSGGGFNTTAGAWASTQSIGWDIAVFKIDFQTPSVNAQASASPQAVGCAPFEVTFTNNGSSAIDYKWFFGDGDSSVVNEPSHMYNDPGVFDVIFPCMYANMTYLFDCASITAMVTIFTISRTELPNCKMCTDFFGASFSKISNNKNHSTYICLCMLTISLSDRELVELGYHIICRKSKRASLSLIIISLIPLQE